MRTGLQRRLIGYFRMMCMGAYVFCGCVGSYSMDQLELVQTEETIEVRRSGKSVLVYNIAVRQPPEGEDPVYERSGFIHPVFTPGGRIVTDDFPEGHVHQHALFYAWTKTSFKGQTVDFWNSHQKLGRVYHHRVLGSDEGSDWISFSVALRHQELVSEAKEIVLEEVWKVTVYEGSEDSYVFDIESEQSLLGEEPLILNEYRYGGAGLRYTGQWALVDDKAPFEFLLSGGQDRIEGNHTPQRWVSASGPVDERDSSIAVLDHPNNEKSPQMVRLHPKMPYFSYSPIVTGELSIEHGKPYRSLYRYVVTDGILVRKDLDEEWERFSLERN